MTINGEPRKVMADQITRASKRRLHRRLDMLGPADLDSVSHGSAYISLCDAHGHRAGPLPYSSCTPALLNQPTEQLTRLTEAPKDERQADLNTTVM